MFFIFANEVLFRDKYRLSIISYSYCDWIPSLEPSCIQQNSPSHLARSAQRTAGWLTRPPEVKAAIVTCGGLCPPCCAAYVQTFTKSFNVQQQQMRVSFS